MDKQSAENEVVVLGNGCRKDVGYGSGWRVLQSQEVKCVYGCRIHDPINFSICQFSNSKAQPAGELNIVFVGSVWSVRFTEHVEQGQP